MAHAFAHTLKSFKTASGKAGQFEVQSSRLALERSQHVGVRGYAGQAVKDADEMINRVKFINNANVGAAMPDGVNTDQRALLVRLTGLSGRMTLRNLTASPTCARSTWKYERVKLNRMLTGPCSSMIASTTTPLSRLRSATTNGAVQPRPLMRPTR